MWRIALIIGLTLFRKGGNNNIPNPSNIPDGSEVDNDLSVTLLAGILNNFDTLLPQVNAPNRCATLEQLHGVNDATFIKVITDYRTQKGKTFNAAIVTLENVKKSIGQSRILCPNQSVIWQDRVVERMQQLGLT